jgi:hypothetical protein
VPLGPRDMMKAIAANLPEKTGKSLQQWIALTKKEGPAGSTERVRWLKSVHELGHVTAQIIAAQAKDDGSAYDDEAALVDNLFRRRTAQRKIYENVLRAVKALPDARPRACKTYVPFWRRRQFALIRPAGREKVELYFAFDGAAPKSSRLRVAPARGGRMSHFMSLSTPEEVDAEVLGWLKRAYATAA